MFSCLKQPTQARRTQIEETHRARPETIDDDEGTFAVGPHEVSDELKPRIDEMDLWEVVDGLREDG